MVVSPFEKLCNALSAGEAFEAPQARALAREAGPDGLLWLALAHARRRRWFETRELTEEALASKPSEEHTLLVAAGLIGALGNWSVAKTHFTRRYPPALSSWSSRIQAQLGLQLGLVKPAAEAMQSLRQAQAKKGGAGGGSSAAGAIRFPRKGPWLERGQHMLATYGQPGLAFLLSEEPYGPAEAADYWRGLAATIRGESPLSQAEARLKAGNVAGFEKLYDAAGDASETDARWRLLRAAAWLQTGSHERALKQLGGPQPSPDASLQGRLLWLEAASRDKRVRQYESFYEAFEAVRDTARGAVALTAVRLGVELWTINGGTRISADIARVVSALRQEQRGIWHPDLMVVPVEKGVDSWNATHGPFAHFRPLMQDLEKLLVKRNAVTIARGRRPAAGEVEPKALSPELTNEELETFYKRGFVWLRGAFSPELALRWQRDTDARLASDHTRWVRTQPPDGTQLPAAGKLPSQPWKWPWRWFRVDASERMPLSAFSPRVYRAVAQLCGGLERLKTQHINNEMVINAAANVAGLAEADPLDKPAWHIDDPREAMRIAGLPFGVLGIGLYSILRKAGGNTWLIGDSLPEVVRAFANAPQGVNFRDGARAKAIANSCKDYYEVRGDPGDFLLIHPLLIHASSRNRSSQTRYMGNPMFYLKDGLDPFREDPSPVEEAIRRLWPAERLPGARAGS